MSRGDNGHSDNPWAEMLRLTRDNGAVLAGIRQEVGSLDGKVGGLRMLVLETRADVVSQGVEMQRHGARLTTIDGRLDAMAARCTERLDGCRHERASIVGRVSRVSEETGRIVLADAESRGRREAALVIAQRMWGGLKWSAKIAVAAAAGIGGGTVLWAVVQAACRGG